MRNIQPSRQLPLLAIQVQDAGSVLPCGSGSKGSLDILLVDMAQNYFNLMIIVFINISPANFLISVPLAIGPHRYSIQSVSPAGIHSENPASIYEGPPLFHCLYFTIGELL